MKKGWREDVEAGRVKSGVEAVRKVVFGWEGGGGGGQVAGGWWEVAGEGSEYRDEFPFEDGCRGLNAYKS